MSPPATAEPVEISGVAAQGGRVASVTPLLEAALVRALEVVRPEAPAQLTAVNVQVTASVPPGEALRARAWVERATRTLAFVSGEVLREGGAAVAAGAGVFEFAAVPLDEDSDR